MSALEKLSPEEQEKLHQQVLADIRTAEATERYNNMLKECER